MHSLCEGVCHGEADGKKKMMGKEGKSKNQKLWKKWRLQELTFRTSNISNAAVKFYLLPAISIQARI
jgi:hypothetical protein